MEFEMSSQITIQTADGRIVHGINFSVNTASLPTDPVALAASMQGGMAYGVYHVYTASGWQYIPASQIVAIRNLKSGAPT
jgi:hypothetical protein